jgi:xylulose-5-phosphate/fructose-6-phosphate phosphoketolase
VPRKIDGHYIDGFWRARQVPMADVPSNAAHLRTVQEWMESYLPENCSMKTAG